MPERILRVAFSALLLCILILWAGIADAAGFSHFIAPDPDGKPLQVLVWYPSDAPTSAQPLGLQTQDVAPDGPVAPGRHALIVISHGTEGSADGHFDTALALANAGFVVAAVEHTGDNYRDRADSMTGRNFVNRPRHIARVIDAMLERWPDRAAIDSDRIGIFGFSAGGYTALVAIGGNSDLPRAIAFCKQHPEDWGCSAGRDHAAETHESEADVAATFPVSAHLVHDPRIKAAVLAAPALGMTFDRAALADVHVPIQLWRAEKDHIVVDRWNTANVLANLPAPPELHDVANADHFAFLAPCSAALAQRAPVICTDPPGFDRAAFHRIFDAEVVRFFQAKLQPKAR